MTFAIDGLGDANLTALADPRLFVVASIPPRSNVLAIGCEDELVLEVLREMECRLWLMADGEIAGSNDIQGNRDDVVDVDLYQGVGPEGKFDVVLLFDMLDGVNDPFRVMKYAGSRLAPRGYTVVSMCNVAHPAMRLRATEGRRSWFFDAESAEEFLARGDLIVFDRSLIRSAEERRGRSDGRNSPDGGARRGSDGDVLHVGFLAAPKGSTVLVRPPVLLARILQEKLSATSEEMRGGGYATAEFERDELIQKLVSLIEQSKARKVMLMDLLGTMRDLSNR